MSTSKDILTFGHKKSSTKPTRFFTLCGRVVHADADYFPHIKYREKTIYFCTDICLGALLADPDAFYKTHRKLKKKKT